MITPSIDGVCAPSSPPILVSSSSERPKPKTASLRSRVSAKQKPTINDLTPSELRTLKLIRENKTSRAIAEELFVSVRTVERHRLNICTKLDLHGSNALLKFVMENKQQLI